LIGTAEDLVLVLAGGCVRRGHVTLLEVLDRLVDVLRQPGGEEGPQDLVRGPAHVVVLTQGEVGEGMEEGLDRGLFPVVLQVGLEPDVLLAVPAELVWSDVVLGGFSYVVVVQQGADQERLCGGSPHEKNSESGKRRPRV
jgi:hypothetical protein